MAPAAVGLHNRTMSPLELPTPEPGRSGGPERPRDPRPRRRAALRLLLGGVALGAGTAALAAAGVSAAATYFARRVVSPSRERLDDVEVLGVGDGTVTLRACPETLSPGRFGLWLDAGACHARLGPVVDHDEQARTVTRQLLGVDSGRLRAGPARWNQYFFAGTPASALGLQYADVEIDTPLGGMPAWAVPASASAPVRDTWAILVHGRGASREECLRALPVLHRLGFPALVVSYRNDVDAARSGRGRYHLGEAEWVDVEAAVLYAAEQGARDVVLVGWSMGGAIAMQTMSRSWTADRVRAVVLDAPVLDWRDVLDHHARVNRVPGRIGRLSQAVLEHPHGRRLAGIEAPVPLDRFDWVARAAELRVPTLLLHSEDDEFVPAGPSRRFAEQRPDLVTFVPSRGARHTQEWNLDPQAWDTAVARFLLRL